MSEASAYILLALAEENHGYAIMQMTEDASRGRVGIGPGTLYGALATMEEQGLIEQTRIEGRRKYYRRREAGSRLLAGQAERYRRFLELFDAESARGKG